MTLSFDVTSGLGGFTLDAAFRSSGRLIALFGPSGSGKTSVVNLIAGLLRPQRGIIALDDAVFVDTDRRVDLPAHKRRAGYVFQDARLFPHLTVSQNLRYGRFFVAPTDRYADFGQIVDLLGIASLLDRRPEKLSGGEKQRVAIGRALLASPRLLLMDEPLAALDDARKAEILPYIERLRDELRIPIVYVSHSLPEVSRLATDVVVMDGGRVTASGTVSDLLGRLDLLPESERAEGGALVDLVPSGTEDAFGLATYRSSAGEWRLPRQNFASGSLLRVRIRARDVMIATQNPDGLSALNVLAGSIVAIAPAGPVEALVTLDCRGDRLLARVTRSSVERLGLKPGLAVYAVIKAVTFDSGSVAGRA